MKRAQAQLVLKIVASTAVVLFVAGVHVDAGERWRTAQSAESCDSVCAWVRDLMQPDNPRTSCCAEADRYEADDFETGENGQLFAIITDGKGDLANGTKIPVPGAKLKWDKGNPTGRGQIFLHLADGFPPFVYCFVPGAGV